MELWFVKMLKLCMVTSFIPGLLMVDCVCVLEEWSWTISDCWNYICVHIKFICFHLTLLCLTRLFPNFWFQIQLDIGNLDESIILQSSISRVEFPGYRAVFTVWLVAADKWRWRLQSVTNIPVDNTWNNNDFIFMITIVIFY